MATTRLMAAVCAAWLFVAPALAQAPGADAPADAMVYASWRGIDALGAEYGGSSLKAVIEATALEAFLTQSLPALMEADGNPEAVKAAALLRDLGPVLWHRPVTAYFAGVRPRENGEPLPLFAVTIDAGPNAETVRTWLTQLVEEQAQQQPDLPLRFVEKDGVFTLTPRGVEPFAGGASLADEAPFKAALAQVGGGGAFVAYADFERILRLIDEAVRRDEPQDFEDWKRVSDALGLGGLRRLAWVGGFEGQGWRTSGFLDMPEPRGGIARLIAGQPIADDELKVVPQSATWMSASRFDLGELMEVIWEVAEASDPRAMEQMDAGIVRANAHLGFDIEEDLLKSLGTLWTLYSDPAVAGPMMGLGVVLVNEPQNPEAVKGSLVKIENVANQAMAQNRGGPQFQFKTSTQNGVEVHSLAFPMLSPSWAVHKGRLYVGLFPQAVVTATMYADKPDNSILQNEKFVAVRNRLNTPAPTTIMFADLPQTAGNVYQLYLMLTQTLTAAAGPNAPAMVLPPLSAILPHLQPAGEAMWVDHAGWHSRSWSPFPGSTMLSQQAMMTGMSNPMLAAMALPALSRAREDARSTASLSNLRQIAVAIMVYTVDHDDVLPAHLADLRPYLNGSLTVFLHPAAGIEAPDTEGWTDDAVRGWLDEHASYVYRKPAQKLSEIQDPQTTILAVEKPHFVGPDGTRAAVYADGHAERRPVVELDAWLDAEPAAVEAPAAP